MLNLVYAAHLVPLCAYKCTHVSIKKYVWPCECLIFLMWCACLWLASHWPNYTRNKPPLLPCFPRKPLTPLTSKSQQWNPEHPNLAAPPPHRSLQPECPSHNSPTPQRASTTSTVPSAPICLLNSPANSAPLPPPHLASAFLPLCPPPSQVSWRHKESRNTGRILMVWSEY